MRVLTLSSLLFSSLAAAAIDRVAVVSRHAPASAAPNASALDLAYGTFTVGNGAFAFNVDCTGLQTLNESYGLGVNTLSDWGYHTAPFAPGDATAALRNFNYTWYSTPTDGHGGSRRIPTFNSGNSTSAVVNWLMSNPHRLNLGQLSLRLALPGGATEAVQLHAVTAPSQRVDIYAGAIDSNFTLTWPGGGACALVDDNDDAALSCAPGGVISALWASYGRPSGSCAAGFVANPACASANSSAVLGTRCIGRASCSIHVDFLAGWGDPCPRQAKWLAVNWTCSGPPPPPPPPPVPVRVRTVVDPDVDLVSVQLECPDGGAAACPLALRLAFAYGTTASSGADWTQPDAHTTTVLRNDSAGVTLLRVLDGDAYRVDCAWSGGLVLVQAAPHVFDLIPPPSDNGGGHSAPAWPRASVSCLFSPGDAAGEVRFPVGASQDWLVAKADLTRALLTRALPLPLFPLVSAAASVAWAAFWQGGAFVDLASNTDDPVAFELERRVVLSRYLMRANNAGAEPPQETGLLVNSWGGKHHNEMRWWHLAHWALWGNADLLARSDGFYFDQLQNASAFAALQGFAGAHWPKETASVANRSAGGIDVPWLGLDNSPWPFGGAPNGSLLVWESPQVDNALIIWQQPHPIWLADAQRRAANASSGGARAAQAVVERQAPLVLATAEFLASRVFFNESDGAGGRWWLGPPLVGGQECGDPATTTNPTFELVYLALALDIANEWLGWLGQPPNERWAAVAGGLAALPTDPASPPGGPPLYTFDRDCVCQFLPGGTANASCDKAWVPARGSNCNALGDHPLQLGILGMIDGRRAGDRYGVSIASANATLQAVWALWPQWTGAWGWDDELLATGMTRLGWDPRTIVEGPLLDPKFPYYANGHTLCCPVYLPGNGGLLMSIAMLAAGSATSPAMHFPSEWRAQAEGFDVPYP